MSRQLEQMLQREREMAAKRQLLRTDELDRARAAWNSLPWKKRLWLRIWGVDKIPSMWYNGRSGRLRAGLNLRPEPNGLLRWSETLDPDYGSEREITNE